PSLIYVSDCGGACQALSPAPPRLSANLPVAARSTRPAAPEPPARRAGAVLRRFAAHPERRPPGGPPRLPGPWRPAHIRSLPITARACILSPVLLWDGAERSARSRSLAIPRSSCVDGPPCWPC